MTADAGAIVDGRADHAGHRVWWYFQRRIVSRGERTEAEFERHLRALPRVTRPNLVALASPKGGVGKTVSTFLLGNVLASHLKLRTIAVDADPDFGTLAGLAPDASRSERSLADLLADADRLATAAALGPYVSRLPTGLHVLGAPRGAARLALDRYGELVAFLATFYEVVLLDLGTGIADPLARFAVDRADQLVLVTTPEWGTSTIVLDALTHIQHDRTVLAINKAGMHAGNLRAIEDRFRAERLHRAVAIPYDSRLATMLDTGTYTLDALEQPTRLAIKCLTLAVSQQLA
jgi:MinD-like ATPase involved in chromosome partitioning or flagellar assembly